MTQPSLHVTYFFPSPFILIGEVSTRPRLGCFDQKKLSFHMLNCRSCISEKTRPLYGCFLLLKANQTNRRGLLTVRSSEPSNAKRTQSHKRLVFTILLVEVIQSRYTECAGTLFSSVGMMPLLRLQVLTAHVLPRDLSYG